MATNIKSNSLVKSNQSRQDLGSKGKSILSIDKKRLENSSKLVVDSKIKSVPSISKTEVKGKSTISSSSKTVTQTVTKTVTKTATVKGKTQKKVYTLAGQKYDPPEEREPLRIFYESLSKQIPSSEMAEFWMMEHGLLSPERSKKAYERKQKRQQQIRMGTPIKSPTPMKSPTPIKSLKIERPESSQKQQSSKNGDLKSKKRVLNYSDDDDDDFIIKRKKSKG
ncbi:uncharacterized protein LOC143846413 [Tasmannia lanceolata]|uniref:uncharacterized protein LOC143846413 n=1 Tax=Tasmannia lanceolata TaxID=3420 RepID=UPI004062E69B